MLQPFGLPGTVFVFAAPLIWPWPVAFGLSMAIDFAKTIKAKKAFGVHDAMIVPGFRPFVGMILKMFVPETEYIQIPDGETKEF